MRVLYFLFEGFDTANGTNHLALTTMHTFLDKGINVYLVSSHSKGIYPDIPDSLINRDGFTYSIIQRNSVEKRNFIKRYIDGMRYAFKAQKEWKKERNSIDAVIFQSTHTACFSICLLHRYLKKPIVYNNFDMFPDGPFFMGAISNKLIYKTLSRLQNYVYKTCSKIVVISDDMKQSFINKGVDESKLVIIPNWYDSKAVKEVDVNNNAFIKKYDIDRKKFIVQYAGNIGYTFNYSAFVEVAKLLKDDENIEIHIIGTGGFEDDFKEAVSSEGLCNIRFFPWQDSSVINDVYSACDIEMVPLSKGVIFTSFPSKCTLLMACGRTFLCMCEKESLFYNEINSERVGICVDRTDYVAAAKYIKQLKGNKDLLNELSFNAKLYGERAYSSAANAYKYVEVVKDLLDKQ